jgi:hypothetical protein
MDMAMPAFRRRMESLSVGEDMDTRMPRDTPTRIRRDTPTSYHPLTPAHNPLHTYNSIPRLSHCRQSRDPGLCHHTYTATTSASCSALISHDQNPMRLATSDHVAPSANITNPFSLITRFQGELYTFFHRRLMYTSMSTGLHRGGKGLQTRLGSFSFHGWFETLQARLYSPSLLTYSSCFCTLDTYVSSVPHSHLCNSDPTHAWLSLSLSILVGCRFTDLNFVRFSPMY